MASLSIAALTRLQLRHNVKQHCRVKPGDLAHSAMGFTLKMTCALLGDNNKSGA
jgi:hypothetical protein